MRAIAVTTLYELAKANLHEILEQLPKTDRYMRQIAQVCLSGIGIRRRHVHCAGMGVPVLKMTAPPRQSFWVPARPHPCNRHAVGDAEKEPIYNLLSFSVKQLPKTDRYMQQIAQVCNVNASQHR